jgi:2-polyprenyl-3-methyl-5-hydroxy-6-metoxy-1,4-benzoquinol methylase
MRSCEICHSEDYEVLHTQHFIIPEQVCLPSAYDVAVCKNCGFLFAVNIAQQEQYDKYYKSNSKYLYGGTEGIPPEGVRQSHKNAVQLVDSLLEKMYPALNKDTLRLLEIGCATGNLLNTFKEQGFKNLVGMEPSIGCSQVAQELYGIRVIPRSIFEYSSESEDTFDLIVLSGVLEHLKDLGRCIERVTLLLAKKGVLLIRVPDVEKFSTNIREPFLEFSLEHINYFTRQSLSNLLGKYGYESSYFGSDLDYPDSYVMNSSWVNTGGKKDVIPDTNGKLVMMNYISLATRKLRNVETKIHDLVKSQEEVFVWGVGSLTSRLLATTELKQANIKAFIDSNPAVQGKKITGIEIVSPDTLAGQKTTVFISTYYYSKEIQSRLLQMNYRGKVIRLEN